VFSTRTVNVPSPPGVALTDTTSSALAYSNPSFIAEAGWTTPSVGPAAGPPLLPCRGAPVGFETGLPFSSVPASHSATSSVTPPSTGSSPSNGSIPDTGETNRSFEGTYIDANESRWPGAAATSNSKAPPGAIGGAPGTSPIGSFGSATVFSGV
jgi:hypothetical protein